MAFKSVKQYNEERYGGFFLLRNDGDYADVIFLYQKVDDVLVADTHYIKSANYSGYVHCCGRGCPACEKNIRVQTKLFIPLYNINEREIQFFDRSIRFENQLSQDVFSKFANPSEYVFRITRHGSAGDVNTTYSIVAVGKNTYMSYNEILAANHTSLPEYYSTVCRDIGSAELSDMLNASAVPEAAPTVDYVPTPRVNVAAPAAEYPQAATVESAPTFEPTIPEPAAFAVLDEDAVKF